VAIGGTTAPQTWQIMRAGWGSGVGSPPSSGVLGGVIGWKVWEVNGLTCKRVVAIRAIDELAVGEIEMAAAMSGIWVAQQRRGERRLIKVAVEAPARHLIAWMLALASWAPESVEADRICAVIGVRL
jgi:hypothetical protein